MTPELISKIAVWRSKADAGTLTIEEMKEAIEALRGNRRSASTSYEQARRAKAKVAIPAADELLKELEGL